jgi:hypothetical protein
MHTPSTTPVIQSMVFSSYLIPHPLLRFHSGNTRSTRRQNTVLCGYGFRLGWHLNKRNGLTILIALLTTPGEPERHSGNDQKRSGSNASTISRFRTGS